MLHDLPALENSPNFDRFRQTILCGEPMDRVPIAELKVEDVVKEAFLGRPFRDLKKDVTGYLEDDIEFSLKAGYDFIRLVALVDYVQPGTASEDEYGHYGKGPKRVWAEEGEGVIKDEADFESFPFPSVDDVNLELLTQGAKLMPSGMEALTSIKAGGIFERVWRLMGFEGFCIATAENPQLIQKLFDKIGSWYCETIEKIVQIPRVEGLWLADDLAYTESLMVSPNIYRKYLFPFYERLRAICDSNNKLLLFHSDGVLWEIMEDLMAIGFDSLHPIEPKAMDIREVKQKLKGRMCIIGNVDLGYTLTRGTPEEVEEEVKGLIRDIAPGGGWCLSSSNSIPEYVPLPNYIAMLKAARKWGNYPVNL